jgi:hypothetical protein
MDRKAPAANSAVLDGVTSTRERQDGNVVEMHDVHRVPISCLVAGDSPRLSGIDSAHVIRLAECGGDLPPIMVHRHTMRIIDGMHRLHAALRNGWEAIDAVFFDGTEDEAFIRAVELNVKHGLPLSMNDRKTAASRILIADGGLSDRAIASKTGLSDKTVAALRARSGAEIPHLNTRVGRDGRVYPVGNGEGRLRAAQLIAERPTASLREIAAAAGVSPAIVSDVRKRGLAPELVPGRRQHDPADRDAQARNGAVVHTPGAITIRGPANWQACDKRAALAQLRADPSVRGKEAGRELLRWLSSHVIGSDDLPECAELIPPHRVPLVAALARQAASAWLELVHRLDSVQQPSSTS